MSWQVTTVGTLFLVAATCGCGKKEPQEIVVTFKLDPADASSRGMISAAETQIQAFDTPIAAFELDVGRVPTTEQGLGVLNQKPAGDALVGWDGPYIDRTIPSDPWGREYRYRSPSKDLGGQYDIWSVGPDGVDGTDDDVYAR